MDNNRTTTAYKDSAGERVEINGKTYMIADLTFADIHRIVNIERSVTLPGTGRSKNSILQTWIKTPIGEIPLPAWQTAAKKLISNAGEDVLFSQLKEWVSTSCLWLTTPRHIEDYALQLHVARIFDDPAWVGFLDFNSKYRPAAIENAETLMIATDCCGKQGMITKASIVHSVDNLARCPHCGKFTTFSEM